jgi:hypothetical protein
MLRRVSLAGVIAVALPGAAAAQFKIEPIGDWDRVTVEHLASFVAATPNTRAARAYCIWDFLQDTGYVEALKADPDVMKAGLARDYACIRLDCKPQGHRGDATLRIHANAPPLSDRGRLQGGASLRMRTAPNEEFAVLFDGAKQRDLSRDGQLELVLFDVAGPGAGERWDHVRPIVMLSASTAFLEQLAAKQKVQFELRPWENSMGPRFSHAGRTAAFSLARMADVLVALREHCAERGRRRN